MNEQDRKNVNLGIALLAKTFRYDSADELFFRGYWLGLKDKISSFELFDRAVRIALEECERMPAPIELTRFARRAARESVKQLPPMSGEEKRRILESWPTKTKNT